MIYICTYSTFHDKFNIVKYKIIIKDDNLSQVPNANIVQTFLYLYKYLKHTCS